MEAQGLVSVIEFDCGYVIGSWTIVEATFAARLIPHRYYLDIVDPVFNLTAKGINSPELLTELMTALAKDVVLAIGVGPKLLELHGEIAAPAIISADFIELVRSPYTDQDLAAALSKLNGEIHELYATQANKQRKRREVESFVRNLIQRAESKKMLSSRSSSIVDAQIDVLNRVLNRLDED